MKNRETYEGDCSAKLTLPLLRQKWAECWGMVPHPRIGRQLLIKSLEYSQWQLETGGLSSAQQARLDDLISAYRRNPDFFDDFMEDIRPGTRLVRMHRGMRHSVLVVAGGYEYRDKKYSSLSEVATEITGTRWNGWVFFGLKKRSKK